MNLVLRKWGNSSGLRVPAKLKNILDIKDGDELKVTVEGKRVVLEKVQEEKETKSIYDLFEGYEGEPFKSELVEFEPIGNEKW